MADVTVTVGASGQDYTNPNTAITDGWTDTSGSGILTVQFRGEEFLINGTNFGSATQFAVSETGESSSHYIILEGYPGERHDGRANAFSTHGGARIRKTDTSANEMLLIETDYTMVRWLEFELDESTNSHEAIRVNDAQNVVVSHCLLYASSQVGSQDGCYVDTTTGTKTAVCFDNCIVWNWGRGGIHNQQFTGANQTITITIDNSTFHENRDGVRIQSQGGGSAATCITNVYNTYSHSYLGNDVTTSGSGTFTWNGSHNGCFQPNTDPNSWTGATTLTTGLQEGFTRVATDPVNNDQSWWADITGPPEGVDYLMGGGAASGTGSNVLHETGTDRQGSEPDSRQDFGIDILGNVRPTTAVDMGAHQFGAAAPGGDVTLTPALGDLNLVGQTPTVKLDFNLSPALGDINLVGQTPTTTLGFNVDPPVGDLNLVGQTPGVSVDINLDPPVGDLNLVGETPATTLDFNVAPGVGALTLTGQTPTVTLGFNVDPAVGALALTGETPTLAVDINVSPPVGDINLVGETPTVAAGVNVSPPVGDLNLTGETPTLAVDINLDPAVGDINLVGQTPATTLGFNVDPPVGDLNLVGQTPTTTLDFNVDPPVGDINLVGETPATTLDFNVDPPVGALTLTGQTPTVTTGEDVTLDPPVGDLNLTGETPTLAVDANLSPAVGALTLTGQTPAVAAGVNVAPAVGTLTLTGGTPVISIDANLSPAAGSLTLAGGTPTVTLDFNLLPITGALTLAGQTPTVVEAFNIAPGLGVLNLTGLTPTVQVTTGTVTLTVPVAELNLAGYAPTLDTGQDVTFLLIDSVVVSALLDANVDATARLPLTVEVEASMDVDLESNDGSN